MRRGAVPVDRGSLAHCAPDLGRREDVPPQPSKRMGRASVMVAGPTLLPLFVLYPTEHVVSGVAALPGQNGGPRPSPRAIRAITAPLDDRWVHRRFSSKTPCTDLFPKKTSLCVAGVGAERSEVCIQDRHLVPSSRARLPFLRSHPRARHDRKAAVCEGAPTILHPIGVRPDPRPVA